MEYFRHKIADSSNYRNWNVAYKHFEVYTGGRCTFNNLSVDYCRGFLKYLLQIDTKNNNKMMASTANNNLDKLKCVLRQAFEEGLTKKNIASRLTHAKEFNQRREFLNMTEVKRLADTNCGNQTVKNAALFSCLTGLRISDIILLKWENIQIASDGGWCMHIVTKKTQTEAFLPISLEALELCGERTTGRFSKDFLRA